MSNERTHSSNERQHDHRHPNEIRRAITINQPPEIVAEFWQKHGGTTSDEHVRFVAAPGGRGTEVHLDRHYTSPGTVANVIKMFRHDHPDQALRDELGALKAIIETGDIMLSDAWVVGPKDKHPAQPDASASSATAHANNRPNVTGAQPETRS